MSMSYGDYSTTGAKEEAVSRGVSISFAQGGREGGKQRGHGRAQFPHLEGTREGSERDSGVADRVLEVVTTCKPCRHSAGHVAHAKVAVRFWWASG